MALLRHRDTARRSGGPRPVPPGRPEEEELQRIAGRRVEADRLRKEQSRLLFAFMKLGAGISDRGWFGDSKKRFDKLCRDIEEIDRKIEELGQ